MLKKYENTVSSKLTGTAIYPTEYFSLHVPGLEEMFVLSWTVSSSVKCVPHSSPLLTPKQSDLLHSLGFCFFLFIYSQEVSHCIIALHCNIGCLSWDGEITVQTRYTLCVHWYVCALTYVCTDMWSCSETHAPYMHMTVTRGGSIVI